MPSPDYYVANKNVKAENTVILEWTKLCADIKNNDVRRRHKRPILLRHEDLVFVEPRTKRPAEASVDESEES